MPADPVKAVFWSSHWLLKVAARYFWLPIGVMVIVEIVLNSRFGGFINGLISGVITFFVGCVVWGALWLGLRFWDVSTTISETISEINRVQQGFTYRRPHYPFRGSGASEPDGNIVEGTNTDLEEQRKKRRQEN